MVPVMLLSLNKTHRNGREVAATAEPAILHKVDGIDPDHEHTKKSKSMK